MYRYFFLFTIIFCNLTFGQQAGSLIRTRRVFDNNTKIFVLPRYEMDTKTWFKDSLLIQEIPGVTIETDINNIETFKTFVSKYIFIDVKNRFYYEYLSFSDTAICISKYFEADSLKGIALKPWTYNNFIKIENLKPISDTIISSVNYKRYVETKYDKDSTNKVVSLYTLYLNCLEKNKFFTFNKKVTEFTGCNASLAHWLFLNDNLQLLSELRFLSNSLTEEEEKIFLVWEKYAKANPPVN